jgi:hypothetical protein
VLNIKLLSGYFPDGFGEGCDGVGGMELLLPGVELLFPGDELLLPVLESYPPGDVAAPVEVPGAIPKCE